MRLWLCIIIVCLALPVTAYSPDDGLAENDAAIVTYTVRDNTTDELLDQQSRKTIIVNYVNEVRGFIDGIMGMKVGEQREFVVSPDQGYLDSNHPWYGLTLKYTVILDDALGWQIDSTEDLVPGTASTTGQQSVSGSSTEGPLDFPVLIGFISLLVVAIGVSKQHRHL